MDTVVTLIVTENYREFVHCHGIGVGVGRVTPTLSVSTEYQPGRKWYSLGKSLSVEEETGILFSLLENRRLAVSLEFDPASLKDLEDVEPVMQPLGINPLNDKRFVYECPNSDHFAWLVREFDQFSQLGLFAADVVDAELLADIESIESDDARVVSTTAEKLLDRVDFYVAFGYDGTLMYIQSRKIPMDSIVAKARLVLGEVNLVNQTV